MNCQGYNEPNAGSDIAGLQTKAEDKGTDYLNPDQVGPLMPTKTRLDFLLEIADSL